MAQRTTPATPGQPQRVLDYAHPQVTFAPPRRQAASKAPIVWLIEVAVGATVWGALLIGLASLMWHLHK